MEVGKVNYGVVGMLWFDGSKAPLEDRMRRAVQYYGMKYDKAVTVVEVPVGEIPEARKVGQLLVIPLRTVLPHHLILFDHELVGSAEKGQNAREEVYQEALF